MSILERIDRMMASARIQGFRPSKLLVGKAEQIEMIAAFKQAQPYIVFDRRGREVTYRGAAVGFTEEPTQLRLESIMLNFEELLELRATDPEAWPEPDLQSE